MNIDWKQIESKYYMYAVRRQPVVIVRGKGTKVWDDEGKEYLDFTSGWAVNNVGHANSVVAEAIAGQAETLLQTSNQFYTVPQLQLAQLLVDNSCLDKVFICNSGAEANEGAVKLARKYGKVHLNGAYQVITALNSFHGRTLAMTAATGQAHYQEPYQPVPEGFPHVPYGDIDALKLATTDKTAAIMLEPVQGEGGVNVPSLEYLEAVRAWCDEKNILLIFDEVQTGIGRLGTLFGYQIFGVEPDVMTLAKGLGGGVPIGAFLAKEQASVFEPKGEHGSTFGGNALTSAAAYASTKYVLDNDLCQKAKDDGEYLGRVLNDMKARLDGVKDVRGIGLLWAMEFQSDLASELYSVCIDDGLLLGLLGSNSIRLMPPLTVESEEIDQAVQILERGITKVYK